MKFFPPIDIDNRRPMKAGELLRVERGFEPRHGFAIEMLLGACVQADVVAGGFDPVQFFDAQKENAAARANHQAVEKLAARVPFFECALQAALDVAGAAAEMLDTGTRQCPAKALAIEGFQ